MMQLHKDLAENFGPKVTLSNAVSFIVLEMLWSACATTVEHLGFLKKLVGAIL